jgi:hypothetical protein
LAVLVLALVSFVLVGEHLESYAFPQGRGTHCAIGETDAFRVLRESLVSRVQLGRKNST